MLEGQWHVEPDKEWKDGWAFTPETGDDPFVRVGFVADGGLPFLDIVDKFAANLEKQGFISDVRGQESVESGQHVWDVQNNPFMDHAGRSINWRIFKGDGGLWTINYRKGPYARHTKGGIPAFLTGILRSTNPASPAQRKRDSGRQASASAWRNPVSGKVVALDGQWQVVPTQADPDVWVFNETSGKDERLYLNFYPGNHMAFAQYAALWTAHSDLAPLVSRGIESVESGRAVWDAESPSPANAPSVLHWRSFNGNGGLWVLLDVASPLVHREPGRVLELFRAFMLSTDV